MRLATKTPHQVVAMRRAGLVVARTLAALRDAISPGTTPRDLDALASRLIRQAGASASFLGYHGYPATICTSVNDVVVHGIPDDRPLRSGDVISIDCGAIFEGFVGDAAFSAGVGQISDQAQNLLDVTQQALMLGISKLRDGNPLMLKTLF